MSISNKFKHLHKAFNDMGCECEVKPSDDPNKVSYVLGKGDATVEFTACSVERRGLAAFLRSHAHMVHIEAESLRMSVPFGHKKPDRWKRRFYMTGLNRKAGDCPVEHHKLLEARKLARDIKHKLGL